MKVFRTYFEGEERLKYERLTFSARKLQKSRSVLFHGTRVLENVIANDALLAGRTGDLAVCFSRSAEVAAYWAMLPRGVPSETPGILVLDRNALKARYKLEPFHDECWDDETWIRDEREERIWDRDVTDLHRFTVAWVR